jgi:hypothetical protein
MCLGLVVVNLAARGFGLPAPKWMLEIETFVMGTETELIPKSRWVKGSRLKNEGFEFRWPDFSAALDDLKSHSG